MSQGTVFPTILHVSNKDSDQPSHLRKLISLCYLPEDTLDPWLPTECPVKTDVDAQASTDLCRHWVLMQLCWKCSALVHSTTPFPTLSLAKGEGGYGLRLSVRLCVHPSLTFFWSITPTLFKGFC